MYIWTEAHFGFGARTIAIIDTMADSPLGQVAMIPMLAWIATAEPIPKIDAPSAGPSAET